LWLLPFRSSKAEESKTKSQQLKMVKSLSALAVLALLAASAMALPSFTPEVKANEAAVLAKKDRLDVRPAAVLDCATQVWPDIAASCLRNANSGGKILEARLVTARR
jgi:hypothetical protein